MPVNDWSESRPTRFGASSAPATSRTAHAPSPAVSGIEFVTNRSAPAPPTESMFTWATQ